MKLNPHSFLAAFAILTIPAQAATVFNEDFESLTLTSNTPDYTDSISGWSRDNSGMSSASTNLAYNGGTAMDVGEWITEQGDQGVRNVGAASGQLTGNALIFDADAWDDTSGQENNGFNSIWSTTVDLTGFDRSTAVLSFNHAYAAFADQEGLVEISFDGTNFTRLATLDSGGGTPQGGLLSFSAGLDFNATSDNMTIRFGSITADNDWYVGFDNIMVEATAIPEPSTSMFTLAGLSLLTFSRKRRG